MPENDTPVSERCLDCKLYFGTASTDFLCSMCYKKAKGLLKKKKS